MESSESNLMLMSVPSRFGEMGISPGQIHDRCAKLTEVGLATAAAGSTS